MGEVTWPMRPGWKPSYFLPTVAEVAQKPTCIEKNIIWTPIWTYSFYFIFQRCIQAACSEVIYHDQWPVLHFSTPPPPSTVVEVIHNHLWLRSKYSESGRNCSSSPAWLNFLEAKSALVWKTKEMRERNKDIARYVALSNNIKYLYWCPVWQYCVSKVTHWCSYTHSIHFVS